MYKTTPRIVKSCSFPVELVQELRRIAYETGQSETAIIQRAVKTELDRIENNLKEDVN